MIHDIKELNFPAYATLSQATVSLNDMGERTITTQIKINGGIKPDFSYDWEIEFQGERYIHPLRSPQAIKDNTSVCSKVDLTFQHWLVYELKRNYFVQLAPINAGTVVPDKYIASLGLNVEDFVIAFQDVLDYYYKGAIKVQLNPKVEYSKDRVFFNISYSYIWDVLQEFYKVYGLRWAVEKDTIKIGYPANEISHIFEYGYNKGLISVERQVQDANIRNSLLGRGGSQNLPKYYFKNAPEGSLYASDPDAIPELENIFFTELRSKVFRDYVQGWKTNPNRDTKDGTIEIEPYDEERALIDYAYRRGHEDEKFDPIEYVKDDASIEKYGVLPGGLQNNEEIYPSIQNISLDGIGLVNEVVAVEPILSDDIDGGVEDEAVVANLGTLTCGGVVPNGYDNKRNFSASNNGKKPHIVVEDGYTGTLMYNFTLQVKKWNNKSYQYSDDAIENVDYELEVKKFYITNTGTDEKYNGVNLPPGRYRVEIGIYVVNKSNSSIHVEYVMNGINLIQSKPNKQGWKPIFDIWIKNIWQTEKNSLETNREYENRVWLPILGDEGRETLVTFSSGWLSSSEGWEFKVVNGGYAYDTSKSHNGVPSHWRLTLQKSDAELKVTNKYIPNMGMQAIAGDTFFFTGINMPHLYTLFGEQRVDEWKYNALQKTKDIQPTWISKLDKVRINTLEPEDTELLVHSIRVGSLLHIADKRFIEGEIDRYVQTITYTYSDKIVPEIEIVLSDKVLAVENPVQQIQGQVDSLSAQIARPSEAWVNQLRRIFDAIYLRKDGVEDMSKSPTAFKSIVKSDDFQQGMIGGRGWGIFRDLNGNVVAEFDQVKARQTFTANDIVRNEIKHQGGDIIYSAASIEVSEVVEGDGYYDCYFDTKHGSKANLFAVDDVALSVTFNPELSQSKSYKSRVLEVGEDYIRLSSTVKMGDGSPSIGDTIIHYGNYTDANRQFVIVRSVVGGGREYMLSGLNAVDSIGKEYYFAGRVNREAPRWFVGDKEDEYAEWKDGKMHIKGKLEVGSDVGGATVVDGGLVTAETISLGSGGNIKAGATGDGSADEDVRFWAGASFEDRANASYRVLQNGTLYASKGVFAGFVKSGTTRITGDNYTEYLTATSLKNYVFDIERCSPCIIFETGSLVPNITLEFPDMEREEALAGLPQSEIDKIRGFINSTIVIYNNSNSNIKFRVVGISGERKEQPDWEITKNGFIKLTCNVNALQSDVIGAKIEYIYWNMSFKGTQMAFTTT